MAERIAAILGTRYTDLDIEKEVLGPLGVEFRVSDGGDPDEIVAACDGADIVLAGSRPQFNAAVIERLDSVMGIVRYGIGVDSVDLDAARAKGLWVARVSDYGTEAVAFHAVTMAVAAFRRLTQADRHVRDGQWGFVQLRPLHLPSASTAGVIGYGRIGRMAARQFRGLGFEVFAHDPYVDTPEEGVTLVDDLGSLLERCDVVSLHLPGGDALIGAAELGRMREGSVLVNTARGSLIDQAALIEALRAGRPEVACLDVYESEPVDVSAFADVLDHVVFTPHMAWYSEESEVDMRHKTALEAARLLRGETPVDVVVDPTQR